RPGPRNSMTDKPKLRWFQFRLRSLLVLMTLSAIFCSWYTCEMQKAAERRSAIEKIIELGGSVSYLGDDIFTDSGAIVTLGEPPSWYSWLRKLHGDEYLGNCLEVRYMRPTDAGLVNLKGLTKLEYLYLWPWQITDAGLVNLKGLTSLKNLGLFCPQVTDEGRKKLQEALPNCHVDILVP
ncbi:MAG: hypothetical protein N2C12_16580, partial [Planctomycetales bacterium]